MCAAWLVLLQHKVKPLLELVSWRASFPAWFREFEKEAMVRITPSLPPHFWGGARTKLITT